MAITLKQLAELSGVSIRTVSRVLKHQEHVQEEKRKLILELARKHHYVPNMAARNLRLNRSRFVGILCSDAPYEIFRQKLQDLESRLESRGYYPVIACCDGSEKQISKIFSDWSGLVDFVVVSLFDIHVSAKLPALFEQYSMTPIYVDQEEDFPGHHLSINRATGIKDAISILIKTGKKRILRCGSLQSRETGLQQAFSETLPDKRPELIRIEESGSFEKGYSLGKEIMDSGADAVFFDTDKMALGFLNYAAEHGISIPDELSVIGFDDDISGRFIYPSLSTVAHPTEELNKAILEIIEQKPSDPVRKEFPTKFIRRSSCGNH
ncbi:MAG: LacI family DNA-binding transcriptional regulator [Lentisphaeria bacterium]|nr:LacI family DNA-binding transcriptional regulator [Lentisphaeria bacterium]